MYEKHRIRLGLNEWNHLPAGYVELPASEPVQGGDLQKLNDERYAEYPARGFLVGKLRGAGGKWYRREVAATGQS